MNLSPKSILLVAVALLLAGGITRWLVPASSRSTASQGRESAISAVQSPAPRQAPPARPPSSNATPSMADVEARMNAERAKLTPERAEAFVQANQRNSASLLAASRVFGQKEYLREAMEKFPNDPRVAFDAYFFTGYPREGNQPASPERRQWLENLKQADPNNPLPDYLAAREDFKAGQPALALQELQGAAAKNGFNSYLQDALQATEEAYRSAGYSEGDAKAEASWNLLLPHLSELKQLAGNISDLAVQYQQTGDTTSAQNLLEAGLTLGQQVGSPSEFPLIDTLVGIAIQKKLLSVMDPGSPYLDTGITVQQQLDNLNQYRESLKSIAPATESILPRLTEEDRVSFYDRLRLFGEVSAVKWAMEKYGGP